MLLNRLHTSFNKIQNIILHSGPTPCNGDSGGGILFSKIDDSIERWYLKGIVSVASWDKTHSTCISNSYTVFTNVSSNADFLRKIIKVYS